jgi:hypothetical protein
MFCQVRNSPVLWWSRCIFLSVCLPKVTHVPRTADALGCQRSTQITPCRCQKLTLAWRTKVYRSSPPTLPAHFLFPFERRWRSRHGNGLCPVINLQHFEAVDVMPQAVGVQWAEAPDEFSQPLKGAMSFKGNTLNWSTRAPRREMVVVRVQRGMCLPCLRDARSPVHDKRCE